MSRGSQADVAQLPQINANAAVKLIGISLVRFNKLTKDGWIVAVAGRRNCYDLTDVVQGFLKYIEHERTRGKTSHELGHHLDISQRRVYDLIEAGIIERPKSGEGFDLDVCRIAVLRHQRKQLAGHGGGKLDLATERAALAREQRETAALKNAIMRNEYVRVSVVTEVVTQAYSIVRENLLGVPGARSYDIACAARACVDDQSAAAVVTGKLRNAIYEVLTNLSEPANHERWRAEKYPHGWKDDSDDEEQPAAAADDAPASEVSK